MSQQSSQIKVLLFGSTGYIGGTAFNTIIQQSSSKLQQYHLYFTLLIRSEEKKQKVLEKYSQYKSFFTCVVHNLNDEQFISDLSSKHDIVMNLANADDPKLAKAIIEGLGRRNQSGQFRTIQKPIYIHNSGTSLLNGWVKPGTETENTKIWTDKESEAIWNLPPSEPHHEIDLVTLHGCEKNGIQLLWVAPPTITGLGTGIQKFSIQVPTLVRAAIARGQAGYVGTGRNSWSYINVEDLADAYLQLLITSIDGKAYTGREGTYFVENGKYQHLQLAKKIAETLHKLDPKKFTQVEAKPFTNDEIKNLLGGEEIAMMAFCGNSVCKAERMRELGWKPHHPGLFDTLEDECRALLGESSKSK